MIGRIMVCIYVLRCMHNKYYVGKTVKNVETRILEHFGTNGSAWTRTHTPLEIVEIVENADEFDEDKYTKKYMKLYGIDNVRGGSYVKIKLTKNEVNFIRRELNTANNVCFRCQKKGHFVKNCIETIDVLGNPIESQTIHLCGRCVSGTHSHSHVQSDNMKRIIISKCCKCGALGHLEKTCYSYIGKSHTVIDQETMLSQNEMNEMFNNIDSFETIYEFEELHRNN